jgi:hypothetical protein
MLHAVVALRSRLVALSRISFSPSPRIDRRELPTLTLRALHDWQPFLDFLCVRRGPIVHSGSGYQCIMTKFIDKNPGKHLRNSKTENRVLIQLDSGIATKVLALLTWASHPW